jgi:Xaa-Pro dipeptidase
MNAPADLFAHLVADASTPPLPDEGEFQRRRTRLGQALTARGLQALYMEHGNSEAYFCGRSGWVSERLSGSLLLADGRQIAVAPAFEADFLAAKLPAGVEVLPWQEHAYGYQALAERMQALGLLRIGLEGSVRQGIAQRLAQACQALATPIRLEDASGAVESVRAIKSDCELALMRRVNALTQRAIEAVASTLVPGVTDLEISARLHAAQRRLGLVDTWDLTLIGPKAAEPHGQPDGTRLASGDVLLIDTGGVLGGYRSDLTRSFVFDGQANGEFERVWRAVQRAQQQAFLALQPGQPCGSIDRAARASLDAAGFGPGYRLFTHRVGHGIGLDIHEGPYLDGGSTVSLEPGMCFTNEPGLYLRGKFGVRLESVMALTTNGGQVFGGWQRSPLGPQVDGLLL